MRFCGKVVILLFISGRESGANQPLCLVSGVAVMGSYENPKVDTRQKTSCTKSGETHTQKLIVRTSVLKFPFLLQLEIFSYTMTY